MEIKGKVHLLFEQSGTFKREFEKLGIHAEDYDIQDNFGETDHRDDLFNAIQDSWDGKPNVLDGIGEDDFTMAFFPCIHFCDLSTLNLKYNAILPKIKDLRRAFSLVIKRHRERDFFFSLLQKMIYFFEERKLRLVIENPYTANTYLRQVMRKPDVLDMNRMERGDFFVKPTAYWFYNCRPTSIRTWQKDKQKMIVINKNREFANRCKAHGVNVFAKGSGKTGLCSKERSMMSPDYARNFICDFILGKEQEGVMQQCELFSLEENW